MGEDVSQGLASQGAQPQPTMKEVVQLLKQGVQPEELIKAGVPPEMVQAAVQLVMQEMGQAGGMQPQVQPRAQPEGLAGARVKSVTEEGLV